MYIHVYTWVTPVLHVRYQCRDSQAHNSNKGLIWGPRVNLLPVALLTPASHNDVNPALEERAGWL